MTTIRDGINREVGIHNGRIYPVQRNIFEPTRQCAYCATFAGKLNTYSSDGSRYCDQTTCKACGITQCMSNGLGNGLCGYCYVGILPGWSRSERPCAYKGCKHNAVAVTRKDACADHVLRSPADVILINRAKTMWEALNSVIVAPANV